MSQKARIAQGGRIDRSRTIRFTFDGKRYEGHPGDTLASALLANGVHLVGRSFKYHRPRGFLSAGSEEPNGLVQLEMGGGRTDPNFKATQIELFDGLVAESQNRKGSLRYDRNAVNDRLAHFLPAGFYYKTFKWPAAFWTKVYEPRIRAAAGLGKAPTAPDPDRYLHRHVWTDVLVVGAGPAGLAAALAAARTGARVILCDEQPEVGGSLLSESGRGITVDEVAPDAWLERAKAELGQHPELTVLTRTTCFGYYDHNYLGLLEKVTDHLADPPPDLPRQRLWRVRAKQVVLATGAIERPLVFPDNDRPGIMLASAARTYLNRFGVLVGREVVVCTSDDSAYDAALDLQGAGAKVTVVDQRHTPIGERVVHAQTAGITILRGQGPVGSQGRFRVAQLHVQALDEAGRPIMGRVQALSCDAVLMCGGWNPTVHLFSQSRGKLRWDEGLAAFVPGEGMQEERSAGACRGSWTLAEALVEGLAAGTEAAVAAGFEAHPTPAPAVREPVLGPHQPVWLLEGDRAGQRAWVDFQNDVTAKDLKLANREGFRSIEHVKRYTTNGMATDQGKTSNVTGLAIVAENLSRPIPEIGTTTFRPPYTPTTFGAFAGPSRGDLFDPVRRTPMHGWAERQGAVFEDVGLWKRAWYFPKPGEDMHAAVERECRAVRNAVGMFDATTLGKIDIQGKDGAEFLNRIYTNAWSKLGIGKCRYGLMLREDGMVFDDGVTTRIGEQHFHMTTTTGGAAGVLAWLESWLQTEWPELQVYLTSVTEQWAVIALQGPKARDVLQAVLTRGDISKEALPHLSMTEAEVAGIPARIFRISFTGELGFEVNVPASYGEIVTDALHRAGQPFGITPYGTEAMHVLRAEKGYIIVGQETDGTVTPQDLGMDWAVSKQKDFLGKRSLSRPDMLSPDRKQLVGLLPVDPKLVPGEGAQIVESPKPKLPAKMIGHVTSSYHSASLGRSFALALLSGGRARHGQRLWVSHGDGTAEVEVTAPVFIDPEGARLHG
ncbi:sarcosine oxidase subunit alpha [Geminicoccus harenae]|uniref:sarcosine oxidase subunit alpha n=3 Tax=Geminicoccus harenae TaxID=2498453 RepID=UPI001C9391ED|nr:sarcosine oxidase subunit alpha [Geminicoccus harenae]